MNTATDIKSMDAETIAHEIAACGKSCEVMAAILAHYGLELHADDAQQFVQRAKPKTVAAVCPNCHEVFDGRRVSMRDLKPVVVEVPHCDECGGPDEYHRASCSVIENSFRDWRDET